MISPDVRDAQVAALAAGYDRISMRITKPNYREQDPVVDPLSDKLGRPARILEVGSGPGRNALRLAGLGHTVLAMDISAVAIGKLSEFASAMWPGGVIAIQADARRGVPDGPYDAVVCCLVLHHLTVREVRELLARCREQTAQGGLNALTFYIGDECDQQKPEFRGMFLPKRPAPVIQAYSAQGWSTIWSFNGWLSGYQTRSLLIQRPEG